MSGFEPEPLLALICIAGCAGSIPSVPEGLGGYVALKAWRGEASLNLKYLVSASITRPAPPPALPPEAIAAQAACRLGCSVPAVMQRSPEIERFRGILTH